MKTLRAVIWICLVLSCAVRLAAQNPYGDLSARDPRDAFTAYTGDQSAGGLSPNWVPANGFVRSFAKCTGYPTPPFGGRNVGIGLRFYNSCRFPYTNTIDVQTWSDDPNEWKILAKATSQSILGGVFPTYYILYVSICRIPYPSGTGGTDPWNADQIVVSEINSYGCT